MDRNPFSDHVEPQFVVRVCLSTVVLVAAFGFIFFGDGDASGMGLAGCGIGLIFGHWMR